VWPRVCLFVLVCFFVTNVRAASAAFLYSVVGLFASLHCVRAWQIK